MTVFRIAVIGGDGIGPEVIDQATRVADAALRKHGGTVEWNRLPWSGNHYLKTGAMMPPDAWEVLDRGRVEQLLASVDRRQPKEHEALAHRVAVEDAHRPQRPAARLAHGAHDVGGRHVGAHEHRQVLAHGREARDVLVLHRLGDEREHGVEFELEGLRFTALNAGPHFTFNEAISMQVICDSQQEVDSLWERLSKGGDPSAQQCGWLKDKYGLSWQIVPKVLPEFLRGAE